MKDLICYAIEPGYVIKEPTYGTPASAGMDIYIPEFTEAFKQKYNELNKGTVGFSNVKNSQLSFEWESTPEADTEKLMIYPGNRVLIPTGLRFEIPSGTYLEVANRGSVASKLGLVYGAHTIDEDYRGIVFINLINTSNEPVLLTANTKIVQLIHKEYIKTILKKIDAVDINTDRGEGALGHTNHK